MFNKLDLYRSKSYMDKRIKQSQEQVNQNLYNVTRKQEHTNRIKLMKIKKCLQTLQNYGVKPEELVDFVKEFGYLDKKAIRQRKIAEYRKGRANKENILKKLENSRKERAEKARKRKKASEIQVEGLEVI